MTQFIAAQAWYPGATVSVEQRPIKTKGTTTPNYWPGNDGRKAAVVHIAQGGFESSIEYMRDNGTSAHFIVSLQGAVKQLVSINDSAWANGLSWDGKHWICPHEHLVIPRWQLLDEHVNPNRHTISIEHEGFTGHRVPPAQLAATIELLAWLGAQCPTLAPYRHLSTLIGHCDLDNVDKAFCPGLGFDLVDIARRANARMGAVEPWLAAWVARGVQLPIEQYGWAIPQLYKQHYGELGACLRAETYLTDSVSLALFEHGLIYYRKSTSRAYLVRFVEA